MNTNAAVLNAKAFIFIAAVAACAFLSAPVQAKDRWTTVTIIVSYAGLDISQPAGAHELYSRLQKASGIACSQGHPVDYHPLINYTSCYEQAIGAAVRSAKQPQLTVVYLKTHTPQEAAARGIEIPVLVAEK